MDDEIWLNNPDIIKYNWNFTAKDVDPIVNANMIYALYLAEKPIPEEVIDYLNSYVKNNSFIQPTYSFNVGDQELSFEDARTIRKLGK